MVLVQYKIQHFVENLQNMSEFKTPSAVGILNSDLFCKFSTKCGILY